MAEVNGGKTYVLDLCIQSVDNERCKVKPDLPNKLSTDFMSVFLLHLCNESEENEK